MKKLLIILLPLILFLPFSGLSQESTLFKTGTPAKLRVNDVNIQYGSNADGVKAEVIVSFDGDKNAYWFQLRKDDNEISHQGMLDLLRDAYVNKLKVKLTYRIKNGSTKGRIIVVELNR